MGAAEHLGTSGLVHDTSSPEAKVAFYGARVLQYSSASSPCPLNRPRNAHLAVCGTSQCYGSGATKRPEGIASLVAPPAQSRATQDSEAISAMVPAVMPPPR